MGTGQGGGFPDRDGFYDFDVSERERARGRRSTFSHVVVDAVGGNNGAGGRVAFVRRPPPVLSLLLA